jgi:hypothetical protein
MAPRVVAALALLLAAAILSFQLLMPPFIGLASNGDFPKVTGRLSLGPVGNWDSFQYFTADYVRDPRYRWDSDVLSSELIPASIALMASEAAGRAPRFDIRWLGALQAGMWLCAFGVLLAALAPAAPVLRLAVTAVWLLIFTDASYVSYLNSFYSDVPAFLGALLIVASGVYLCARERPSWPGFFLFTGSALFFITSKAQHAMWGIVPAVLLVWLSTRRGSIPLRASAVAAAFLLCCASAFVLLRTPARYSHEALFNILFYDELPHSRTPVEDLTDLGLDASYAKWIGINAYVENSPTRDVQWMAEFIHRTSYGRLARLYWKHPGYALTKLRSDLINEAPLIRPFGVSNFQRRDGHPPGAQTTQFSSWSSARSQLIRVWPYHLVCWYAFAFACAVWIALTQSGIRKRLAWLALGIIVVAVGEFVVASLSEAIETYRHLFLFHTLTDVTLVGAVAAGVDALTRMRSRTRDTRSVQETADVTG